MAPPGLNSKTDEKPALSTESPGSTRPRSGWKINENAQGMFMAIGAKIRINLFFICLLFKLFKISSNFVFLQLPESLK